MSRLTKEEHLEECRWTSPNLLRNYIEQKGRERKNLQFCSDWDTHLLLPSVNGTLVLEPSDLKGNLHNQPFPQYSSLWTQTQTYTTGTPGFQAFGLGLNYITGFPGSLVADSRSLHLASMTTHEAIPVINPFLYICVYWSCFSSEP